MSKKRYVPWPCMDCNVDTDAINEIYIITHDLWRKAVPEEDSSMSKFLCIGCLEKRMGRELCSTDFPEHVPMNWPQLFNKSERLLCRMKAMV
jgi:hypothetical protein